MSSSSQGQPMDLSARQLKFLRARAHDLKPVIQVGRGGFSEGVRQATAEALACHELIKVKIAEEDREVFRDVAREAATALGAHLVHSIGRTVVFFRPADDVTRLVGAAIKLPD